MSLNFPGCVFSGIVAFASIAPGLAAADTAHVIQISDRQWRECQSGKKSELCDLVRQSRVPARNPSVAREVVKAPPQSAPPPDNPAPIPPLLSVTTSSLCQPDVQGLFVRADPLDNFNYAVSPADPKAAAAKGLDVSYTNNHIAGTQTATINGRISYLLLGELCDPDPYRVTPIYLRGMGLAPFVSGSGTWNEPLVKTSNSALKGGADFQIAIATPFFPIREHYLYFSPYHQTDFRGLAHANGVTFGWEPVAPDLFLDAGKPFSAELAPYFLFFWQVRPEVDYLEVTNTGLTNLTKGTHTWVGESLRANLAVLPLNPYVRWPEWIGGRLSLIGTAQNFYDVRTSTTANYYTFAVQYKLGPCKRAQPGSKDVNPCAIQGSSSLSFEYDWGTSKDTLVNVNQYLIKLGFAY